VEKTQNISIKPNTMITVCQYWIKLRQGVIILCSVGTSLKSKVSGLLLCKLATPDA